MIMMTADWEKTNLIISKEMKEKLSFWLVKTSVHCKLQK